jgi:uncharacterized protein YoxC
MAASVESLNMPIWIMAAVSLFEALVLIAVVVGGAIVYRRLMRTIAELESRQVAPLRERVEDILRDVNAITTRVSHETERVDQAIHTTIDRVDETAARVTHSVRDRVAHATGIIRGVRAVIVSLLSSDSRQKPPAEAAGRL